MLCDITVHGIVDAMRKQHSRSTLGCRLRVLELDDGMIGDQGKRHNASFCLSLAVCRRISLP